ncbi:MAG: hypothetical protein HY731_05835, partial [Candidatus Tectomicrobia bacterium]|nr:hypothetical protein [Candidatus Tectomicrobia bacterium]
PEEIHGTAFGLLNGISFIGSLISPWATGAIKDATGSFAWGCYTTAILAFLGALLVFAIRPPFRWEAELPLRDQKS